MGPDMGVPVACWLEIDICCEVACRTGSEIFIQAWGSCVVLLLMR
jgi:hypothetical protein